MAIRTANNQSLTEITAVPSAVALGGMVLLETQTASSDSTISFTSNIDSTYKEYVFKFINIHPSATQNFTFQANASGGSGYNETMTTTHFIPAHDEADTTTSLGYQASLDQAQGTAFQRIGKASTGNDECISGELWLFGISSTTFVKHFMSRTNNYNSANSQEEYVAGYFNTTSALDEFQFKLA